MIVRRILVAVGVVLTLVVSAGTLRAQGSTPKQPGMVAADHPLAAEAGAAMLRAGGNAVDAAVATSLALSVVRPDACGIGGGGFMLVHLVDDPRHGTVSVALNYRETCPAAIGPESYAEWDDPEASRRGGKAIAVPGTVAGLLYALETYGTLDRETVFAPAISLAENGFHADEHHARTAASLHGYFRDRPDRQRRFPLVWDRLMRQGAVQVGSRITLPEQASALRLIAQDGAQAFYRGPIAEAIVRSVADADGVLSMDDLAGYQPEVVEPIDAVVGGYRVLAMPPPSSGGVAVVQLLALADRLGVDLGPSDWPDSSQAHLLAECMKHAFADRSRHMGDPRFTPVPVDEMIAGASLDRVAASIDPGSARASAEYGTVPPIETDGGTSHISVIDAEGNAVACTETINLAFGSLVGVEGFGFCLNNQMDDFTTIPGQANAFGLIQSDVNLPEPGKRPLSSMSPTIVLDDAGRVVAVAGASGGPRIISATAQVLLRQLRSGATPRQAVDAPRIHHQWLPDRIEVESGLGALPPDSLLEGLRAAGHAVGQRPTIASVQALARDAETGEVTGAADPRKGGGTAR